MDLLEGQELRTRWRGRWFCRRTKQYQSTHCSRQIHRVAAFRKTGVTSPLPELSPSFPSAIKLSVALHCRFAHVCSFDGPQRSLSHHSEMMRFSSVSGSIGNLGSLLEPIQRQVAWESIWLW